MAQTSKATVAGVLDVVSGISGIVGSIPLFVLALVGSGLLGTTRPCLCNSSLETTHRILGRHLGVRISPFGHRWHLVAHPGPPHTSPQPAATVMATIRGTTADGP